MSFRIREIESDRQQGMRLMPRYYFSVTNGRPFNDTDGLELPDLTAVREEALGFAQDLIRMELERRDWSAWTVRVTDEAQTSVLDLSFLEAT
jgi:hypothetical protein